MVASNASLTARWEALKVAPINKVFILHREKSQLENATGFDKDIVKRPAPCGSHSTSEASATLMVMTPFA
jgi:hypothetical protein